MEGSDRTAKFFRLRMNDVRIDLAYSMQTTFRAALHYI